MLDDEKKITCKGIGGEELFIALVKRTIAVIGNEIQPIFREA